MYNRNHRVRDSPLDAPNDLLLYRMGLRKKFYAALAGCAKLDADTLIMPDLGCGVFQNDPMEVGLAFCDVYNLHFRGLFGEIIFTGKNQFVDAVLSSIDVSLV